MSQKWTFRWAKLRRFHTSIPTGDLQTAIIVVVGIVTLVAPFLGGNMTSENSPVVWMAFKVAVVVGLVLIGLLLIKTRLEYRRRTYDPTLMLEFQRIFDGLEDERDQAAKVCMTFLKTPEHERKWASVKKIDREKVEPVLDWLDDLGFFLHGDQISDEVIHHAFFHWIRGWYSNLEAHAKYCQEVENEKAAYEHIKPLLDRISEIEKRYERTKLWLSTDTEKLDFLEDELKDND